MALFQTLIFFLMLLGFLSALLWLPALCLGGFLLTRERRSRLPPGGGPGDSCLVYPILVPGVKETGERGLFSTDRAGTLHASRPRKAVAPGGLMW